MCLTPPFLSQSHIWGMKREPIKTPFLSKSRDADYSDSLAVFKLILRFMNDPALSGLRETVLGNYITNKVNCVCVCVCMSRKSDICCSSFCTRFLIWVNVEYIMFSSVEINTLFCCAQGLANERLRDEILCQLCNQTWRNDNTANAERGWLLLANCLSVFPPTSTLYKYILK